MFPQRRARGVRTTLSFLCVLILACLATSTAVADEYTRKTLSGLRTVRVVVENIEPEAERQGLAKSSIQTDVEIKLRQAGIVVQPNANAWIYVNVNLLVPKPQSYGLYAYCVHLELNQSVALIRDPQILLTTVTWAAAGNVGTVGATRLSGIRDILRDMVDEFINDWLAVNVKR